MGTILGTAAYMAPEQAKGRDNRGIYAGTIDGSARTLVLAQPGFDLTAVQYSSSGHIVYVRNHQLVARPFDADRLAVTGDEVALADGFGIGGPGRPRVAVSRTGTLVFRPMGDLAIRQPTWFTRRGIQQGALGTPGPYNTLELSRDGRMLAADRVTEKEVSIWLLDMARGTSVRFTSEPYSTDPVWLSDGDRVAYISVRDTPPNPFVRTLSGVETRLARLPGAVVLTSVTPDGQTLIGDMGTAGTGFDLWLFSTSGASAPAVFLQTPFDERDGRLAPDSRWATFTSNESGIDIVVAWE